MKLLSKSFLEIHKQQSLILSNKKGVGEQYQLMKHTRTLSYISVCTALIFGSPMLTRTAFAGTASVNKTFSPGKINPGDTSTLTITLFNSAQTPLTNSALTDNLPSGMKVAPTPNASTTCGTGSVSSVAGGSVVSLSGGSVPAASGATSGRCIIQVDVTSTTSGNLINTIPEKALSNNEKETNTESASATLQVNNLNPVTVNNGFSPTTISAGGTSTYTITLNNPNSIDLPGATLTKSLPPELSVAGTPTTTCGNGTVSVSGQDVSLNSGTIPAGTSGNVGKCTITIPVTSTTVGSYPTLVPASSLTTSRGVTNTKSGTTTLNVQAGVIVSKKFLDTLYEGGSSRLEITITNGNSIDLTNTSITDNLPSGMFVANPASSSTTCTGGTVSAASGGTAISLSSAKVPKATSSTNPGVCKITVRVNSNQPVGTILNNTIPADSLKNDQNETNGSPGTQSATVQSALDLSKGFIQPIIVVNGITQLQINITNRSSIAATGVKLTDNLPANVVIANPANPSIDSTNCGSASVTANPGSGSVAIANGTIPSGNKTCIIKVDVTSTVPGIYTNKIPANSLTSTQGWTVNQERSAQLTVESGLSISKAFSPSTVAPNVPTTLTVTLTNSLSSAITGVAVTDPLPSNTKVAPSPNASTTCANATFTPTAGATSVKISGATVPPKVASITGTCTFSVDVVKTDVSKRTNTIPANSATSNQGITNTTAATADITTQNLTVNLTKAFSPVSIDGGDPSTLTVTLSNPNNTDLNKVGFTDNMPTGMLVFATPEQSTTCSGGVVSAKSNTSQFSLSGGTIPANGSCTVTLKITSTRSGNLTNTLPVNAITSQQGATNSQAASATLTTLPAVAVTKVFDPSEISQYATAKLIITLLNSNSLSLTGVNFTDNLPAGMIVAPTPNINNKCDGTITTTANSVSLSNGTIAGSSSCTVEINIKANGSGNLTNTIAAQSLKTDQGTTNKNPGTATIVVQPISSNSKLLLVKRITRIYHNNPNETVDFTQVIDDPNTIDDNNSKWQADYLKGAINGGTVKPGDELEYTIYFLSSGDTPIKNVSICDLIPANSSFVENAFAPGSGIALEINTTTNLTNISDSDRGEYIAPNTLAPGACNKADIANNVSPPTQLQAADNKTGVVLVNVVTGSTTLPEPNQPAYGFIRFRVKVK